MTTIRCPRCRDEVSVPPRATSRALVRCPLCLEQYLLAEAIAGAPPALVIIGGEVEPEALPAPAGDEDYRLTGPVETPAYHPGRVAAAEAIAARPAVRSPARQRPRQASPLLLIVNYVGGGVMGLALGLLVLWWGFKRDPLELGPTFAAYVPWVVPAEFRGKPAATPAPETPPPTSDISANVKRRKKAAAPDNEPLQSLPTLEGEEPPSAALTPAIEPPILADPTIDRPARKRERASDPVSAVDPAAATIGEPASLPPAPDLTSLLPDEWPIRVPEKPQEHEILAAADLTNAIEQAAANQNRYREAAAGGEDARREAFIQVHADLGEVGRLLSYREAGQTGLAPPVGDVEKLLAQLAGDAAAMKQLQKLTAEHWTQMPDGRGLFAVGTVTKTGMAGELYTVALGVDDDENPVTLPVAIAKNPENLCQTGDRLLVVGRIVEEPKINLPGYDGAQPKVLMSGLCYNASK